MIITGRVPWSHSSPSPTFLIITGRVPWSHSSPSLTFLIITGRVPWSHSSPSLTFMIITGRVPGSHSSPSLTLLRHERHPLVGEGNEHEGQLGAHIARHEPDHLLVVLKQTTARLILYETYCSWLRESKLK